MTVKDGKIIQATNDELYSFWLKHWAEFYPYDEYKQRVIDAGTEVVE